MAYLSSSPSSSGDPQVTSIVRTDPMVEPLGGPPRLLELMDRFPESVYAQGPDTHLYKFLETLCGDAGAGLLQKQTFLARLQGEAETISYRDLDDFYTNHFRFSRLRPETYSFDTDAEALSPDEWDDVQLKDARYKHRAQKFFNATREGCTPLGMALAAEGGSGVECEVREHYRFIFDQYSDDPLGLDAYGKSSSVSEFVVMPRISDSSGNFNTDYAFDMPFVRLPTFYAPTLGTSRPQIDLDPVYVTEQYVAREDIEEIVVRGWYFLTPDIQRNMLDVLDRLRPVGCFVSSLAQEYRHIEVTPSPVVDSSTERILPTRFVNGRPDVDWPEPSAADGYFIEGGVEKQAVSYADSQIELPDIFHTVDKVVAYTEAAIYDSAYGTSSFMTTVFPRYRSEHAGTFTQFLTGIFPALASVSTDQIHSQENVLAPSTLPVYLGTWREE